MRKFQFYFTLIFLMNQIKQSFTRRILFQQDLVGEIKKPSGWSVEEIYTGCDLVVESIDGVLKLQKSQKSEKTFVNLPPHWSIQIDVSIYMIGAWGKSELASMYIDDKLTEESLQGFQHPLFKSQDIQIYKYNDFICQDSKITLQDGYVQWSPNITHSGPNVKIKFENNIDTISKGFAYSAFNNIRIFLDLCDETCATCFGPTQDQCLTCPSGSDLVGTACKCQGTKVAQNHVCISNCPFGMWQDPNMKKCVFVCNKGQRNCVECVDERHCKQCIIGWNLLKGDCVNMCPRRYDAVQGVCVKIEETWLRQKNQLSNSNNKGGKLLYGGLDSNIDNDSKLIDQRDFDDFEFEIKKLYPLTPDEIANSKNSYVTSVNPNSQFYVCKNGERMLGGFQIIGNGRIRKRFSKIKYHWRIRVKVKLWQIDSWNQEYLKIETEKGVIGKQFYSYGDCTSCKNFCGSVRYHNPLPYVDYADEVDAVQLHDGDNLYVDFQFAGDQNSDNESFAISDLYILIDECPNQLCTKCDQDTCSQCVKNAYIYKNLCVDHCPDGMFGDDKSGNCLPCNKVCETCVTTADNCTKCADFRIGASIPKCDCPDGKFTNSEQMCIPCGYQCQTCKNSLDNCTDCAANRPDTGIPKCKCPIGFYDQGYPYPECKQCFYKCSVCEKSERNCLKCEGKSRQNPPQCNCGDGFYDDGKSVECQPCHKVCKTCEYQADICTSCAPNRDGQQCACQRGMFQLQSGECGKCNPNCLECKNKDECTVCQPGRINFPRCDCPLGQVQVGDGTTCTEALSNKCDQMNSGIGVLYLKECDCNEDEYYDNNVKQCTKCSIEHCKKCKTQTECDNCIHDTILIEGSCIPIVTDQTSSQTLTISVFVICGIGICIWLPLVLRKIYKSFLNKQSKPQNSSSQNSANYKGINNYEYQPSPLRNDLSMNDGRNTYKENPSQNYLGDN